MGKREKRCPLSSNLAKVPHLQTLCSVREPASCCQPTRRAPGLNSSGGWYSGRSPLAKAIQDSGLQPNTRCGWVPFQLSKQTLSNHWMAFEDHGDAIRPTCPVLELVTDPPNTKGKDAKVAWVGSICKKLQTHCHLVHHSWDAVPTTA